MKLWFDEDLSPTLVQVANDLGFQATCNRDRGLLGTKDADLRRIAQAEGYIFAADNASDFRPMYARDEIHPGTLGRAHPALRGLGFLLVPSGQARMTGSGTRTRRVPETTAIPVNRG